MPTPHDVVFFETRAELREWFKANHETAAELWIGYLHKSTGLPSVTWQELVDQALCFGWIDSVRYGQGDGRSAQRVTPRRKRSVWSAVNIRRFQELEAMGLVHPTGRAAFEARDPRRSVIYAYENQASFDAEAEARFRAKPDAWTFFQAQPAGYRRNAVHWVMRAVRTGTRDRRLEALIDCSARGERLPPQWRPEPEK